MHILLVNDDGPPSDVSPYFLPFVTALQTSGHRVRAVIPDRPLSWIGKAHAFGKTLTLEKVCPSKFVANGHCQNKDCDEHSWWVLDGSPASCTQIGLFHMDWAASEIELVISGPNHGRNASTIYNLSSGTVGGAFEGALCGKKAVSLSFGSKDPQPCSLIEAACQRAVHLIELLCRKWNPAVEVYNVNIPMTETVSTCPAYFATPTRAYWGKGSLFAEAGIEINGLDHPEESQNGARRTRYFKWAPELSDVKAAAIASKPGEDLWASMNDIISVTGFQANFASAGEIEGLVELEKPN